MPQLISPEDSSGDSVVKPVNYAGFWLRAGAFIIDHYVIWTPCSLIIIFLIPPIVTNLTPSDPQQSGIGFFGPGFDFGLIATFGLAISLYVLAFWLYYALMESSVRQGTLGKMAVGLKVTDLDGNRISFGRASGRTFAKIISALIIFIGFIMAIYTEKKQGLHDMLAGCLVVKK